MSELTIMAEPSPTLHRAVVEHLVRQVVYQRKGRPMPAAAPVYDDDDDDEDGMLVAESKYGAPSASAAAVRGADVDHGE